MRAIESGATRIDPPLEADLRPHSPVPLYTQIRELLRERILGGRYKPHDRMPSENDMVRAFGVSRITVRQALTDLARQGLIFRVHGKGTFVAKSRTVQRQRGLASPGEATPASGREVSSKVTGHRVMRPDALVAARLGLAEGDEVMEIHHVSCLGGQPIAVGLTYVPLATGKRLVTQDLEDLDTFPLRTTAR